MIGHLVSGLQCAVNERAESVVLERHLEGISAIAESHFRYEERQLLTQYWNRCTSMPIPLRCSDRSDPLCCRLTGMT